MEASLRAAPFVATYLPLVVVVDIVIPVREFLSRSDT